jgi:hypothetical protein
MEIHRAANTWKKANLKNKMVRPFRSFNTLQWNSVIELFFPTSFPVITHLLFDEGWFARPQKVTSGLVKLQCQESPANAIHRRLKSDILWHSFNCCSEDHSRLAEFCLGSRCAEQWKSLRRSKCTAWAWESSEFRSWSVFNKLSVSTNDVRLALNPQQDVIMTANFGLPFSMLDNTL